MFGSTKQPACGYPCSSNGLHYVFFVVVVMLDTFPLLLKRNDRMKAANFI